MGQGNQVRWPIPSGMAGIIPGVQDEPHHLRVPVDLATREALTEWAAEVGIGVEDLALRLLARYLRSPAAERDPVDDLIGETLLARMGDQGHISTDVVARFREAAQELLLDGEPAPANRDRSGEAARC